MRGVGRLAREQRDAADRSLKHVLVDVARAAAGPKRCQAARLKSLTQAASRRLGELVKRGADAALAKAIRDGDDDVRFAAWACCTAAVWASPTLWSGCWRMRACTSFW